LKIHIHGIPYVTTFIVLQNSVVDSNYFMLLGRPWLKDAKVHMIRVTTKKLIKLCQNILVCPIILTQHHIGSDFSRLPKN
jgi:hypothetical protein